MENIKKKIEETLKEILDIDNIFENISEIKEEKKGDYTFPCFILSKTYKKAPNIIAAELKEKIEKKDFIEKIESVNGYLNFYVDKKYLTKIVFEEYDKKKEDYGKNNNCNKTVLIEYSSPNISKPFHIGHLRTTVIGHALYNIYKFLGYNTIGINHLGDYGTHLGKIIEAYKLWGNEYNIEENPIDELTKMYVRINKLCEEDETVLENCRNNFKLLEEGDEYCNSLCKKISDLSLIEFNRVYDLLGIKFDSIKGESTYVKYMNDILKVLEKNNKLLNSEGAKIVDLEEDGIKTPCIIQKNNGSSIYATRDLGAILYRSKTYDYDKSLYVTGYEQELHFKQVFAVAKYLDLNEKYINGLEHISYGMYRLKEGKMSTRKGNFVKLEDILIESINKAKEIIKEKNPNLENIDEVAKKVGVGAVVFSDLYNSRIKDEVFDLDEMLSFQGETCPYIQYMYVRINSILSKVDNKVLLNNVSYDKLTDEETFNIIKLIYKFNDIVSLAAEKNEPYIISRYLIKLSNAYSSFYTKNKVLSDDIEERNSRLYLIKVVGNIIKTGSNLLGIEMPEKM